MSTFKAWIEAARLRTLPLALSTILMGSFIAYNERAFDWVVFGLAILTTVFLQVLSNLANDYGDAKSGVDGDHRTGPARLVQAGVISAAKMRSALIIFAVLSLVSGLCLLYISFGDQLRDVIIFLLIGIGAIIAAIKYTVGNNPYGYAGFGDIFVLIFFGWVGVAGCTYLYTHQFEWIIMLPATSLGLLSVGVLNVNNIRDIESDRHSGKNSIPVRIGRKKAIIYHWFLLLTAIICMVFYVLDLQGDFTRWLFLLAVPLIVANGLAVSRKKPDQLDPLLRQLAISTLLLVILLGIGLLR